MWGYAAGDIDPLLEASEVDLRTVESVSVRRVKDELSDLLRKVESGAHFMVMRRLQAVAALIPSEDYQHYQELIRREALVNALLRGRGLELDDLTTEGFIDLLDAHVRKGG